MKWEVVCTECDTQKNSDYNVKCLKCGSLSISLLKHDKKEKRLLGEDKGGLMYENRFK